DAAQVERVVGIDIDRAEVGDRLVVHRAIGGAAQRHRLVSFNLKRAATHGDVVETAAARDVDGAGASDRPATNTAVINTERLTSLDLDGRKAVGDRGVAERAGADDVDG